MSYAKKSKIRESKTHKEVIPYKGYDGRMKVRLIDNFGHEQEEDFAELVARTFPEMVCGTKQEGVPYPYHRDNNPENNAVDNLFWPDKELYDCDNNKASVVSLIDTSAADYGEIALMLNRLLLDLGDYGERATDEANLDYFKALLKDFHDFIWFVCGECECKEVQTIMTKYGIL